MSAMGRKRPFLRAELFAVLQTVVGAPNALMALARFALDWTRRHTVSAPGECASERELCELSSGSGKPCNIIQLVYFPRGRILLALTNATGDGSLTLALQRLAERRGS